jgi:predicted acetyltransferase
VSTLYPFKDTFYIALGYLKMPPTHKLEMNPSNLSRVVKPEAYSVGREMGDDAFDAWRSVHEGSVKEIHGGVLRSDIHWKDKKETSKKTMAIARNQEGKAEGVMVYTTSGYGEGHEWAPTGTMSISEIHWTTLEARDALLNFIYLHADQIVNVKMVISNRMDDYYHWTSELHTLKIKANIVNMARIVDIENCFNDLQAPGKGEIVFEVVDSNLAWNNAAFQLTNNDGILTVEKTSKKAKTQIRIEGLAGILYGTLGEDSLRRMELLKGESPIELFDWFPRAVPWLTEDF